jgi:alcohol dehydrogenase class IV
MIFHSARSIRVALGASKSLGETLVHHVASNEIKRSAAVLVVTDRGILKTGLELPALQSLKDEGLDVIVYDGVLSNPPESNVKEAVQLCKNVNARAVIGLGGGSPMDVAKLTAFLAYPGQKQQLSDIYGVNMCRGPRLPLVQIPTTAGTGSEVTPVAIITTGESEKKGVVSSQLLPDVAILGRSCRAEARKE